MPFLSPYGKFFRRPIMKAHSNDWILTQLSELSWVFLTVCCPEGCCRAAFHYLKCNSAKICQKKLPCQTHGSLDAFRAKRFCHHSLPLVIIFQSGGWLFMWHGRGLSLNHLKVQILRSGTAQSDQWRWEKVASCVCAISPWLWGRNLIRTGLWREAVTLQLHVPLQPVNAGFCGKDSVNPL